MQASILLLILATWTASLGEGSLSSAECQLSLDLVQAVRMEENSILGPIGINCSCCYTMETLNSSVSTLPGSTFLLTVRSDNEQVTKPSGTGVPSSDHPESSEEADSCRRDSGRCSAVTFTLPLPGGASPQFYLEAVRVGRTNVQVSVLLQNPHTNSSHKNPPKSSSKSQSLSQHSVPVSVVRRYRIFYTIFDISVAVIASMTALSVGCCTQVAQWRCCRRRLLFPLALGLLSQHLVMPLIAFLITLALSLPDDLAYGLLAITTVPGGGLAYLVVFLVDADQQLSTIISFFNSIGNFAFSWIWLYAMCWYWRLPLDVVMIFLWLSPVLLSHGAGLLLRHYHAPVAEAVLTWFTRPLLLFSGILLVTLGVYINHYAFHFVNYTIVSAILALICGGFCLGGGLGLLCKLDKPVMKTLAAETSVFNCLIVIPTLRYALPQPDADLAATVPLWGIFFTPTPVVMYFVVHKVKACVVAFVEKRKMKQYKHYSVVTSLARMTEDVAALSAPAYFEENHAPQHVLMVDDCRQQTEKEERTTSL